MEAKAQKIRFNTVDEPVYFKPCSLLDTFSAFEKWSKMFAWHISELLASKFDFYYLIFPLSFFHFLKMTLFKYFLWKCTFILSKPLSFFWYSNTKRQNLFIVVSNYIALYYQLWHEMKVHSCSIRIFSLFYLWMTAQVDEKANEEKW